MKNDYPFLLLFRLFRPANHLRHRFSLLLLLCFSTQLATFAQNGPTCSTYTTIDVTNSSLASNTIYGIFAVAGPTSASVYAATNSGLGISTDGGSTFTNRLIGNSGLGDNRVNGVFVLNSVIYAATSGGLSISTDGGTSFTNRTNGLGSVSVNGVYAVSGPGSTTVYAATNGGLSVSTDGGTTFVNRTTSNGLGSNAVNGVYAVSGPGSTTVYAATNSGVSISTNGGTSFVNRTNGLITTTVNGVYAVSGPSSTTVYAAVNAGLGISTNGGTSFTTRTKDNSGLGLASGSNPANGVFVLGNTVYAAVQGGLSISTDRGNTFTNYTTANGLGNNFVSGVYVAGDVIYAATNGGVAYCDPASPTPAIADLTGSPNLVCASSPVTFTATVGNVTSSYNYTLTNGSSPLSGTATGNFSQSLTASGSGVQTYTLTVSNGGQSATAMTSLTVGQPGVVRLYVKANASGANTGVSWQDAFTDLQSALKYPCLGSLREIWIARGAYKPRSSLNLNDAFSMLPDVAIYGGFDGTETDLSQRPPITLSNPSSTTLSADVDGDGTSANNSYFLIYNTRRLTSTAILDGVVITPPTSGSSFGAVMNNSNGNTNETSPELQFGSESSPQYRNLLFTGNNSSLSVVNTAIKGGITSPSFINCVFRDNPIALVFNQGNDYSSGVSPVVAPQFVNCVIANNVNSPGFPFLILSQANSTDQSAFINCSFLNLPTGVVATNTNGLSQNDIRFTNCVLWNTGGANTFTKANANSVLNVTVQYSLLDQATTGYTSGPGNQTTTGSSFVSATSAQLRDCSVAINTGSNQAYTAVNGPTTDIAGNARQYNGGVIDRGAYEYQNNPSSLTVGNPSVTTAMANQPFSQSFTASGGGSGVYSFSVVSGNLPTSLSLSASGVLSGTPTVAGSYSVLVSAQDQNGCVGVASAAYNLTVNSAALPCGTVVYVTQTGAGLQDGSSWTNAFSGTALQTAINTAANCGAQVWVAQGIYKPTTGTDVNISFVMKEGIAIYGGFTGVETAVSQRPAVNPVTGQPSSSTLSGDIGTPGDSGYTSDNSAHVVRSEPGLTASAVLDGFVVTRGNASNALPIGSNQGGGLYNVGSSPAIRNCYFVENNGSNAGGGIYNQNGNLSITNCRFGDGGTSNNGTALGNTGTCSVTIASSLFDGKITDSGGGIIQNYQGNIRLTITGSTFRDNTISNYGCIYNVSGATVQLEMTDCVVQNNTSGAAAGIFHFTAGSIVLTRCQFVGNSVTDDDGGAIYFASGASLVAHDCSFTGNSASGDGGAIYLGGSGSQALTLDLTGCVFSGNRSGGYEGGAVFVDNLNASPTLINTSFVSNTATNGRAGALGLNTNSTRLINCSFIDNRAAVQGGAIYAEGNLLVTNSSFQGNQAPQGRVVYADGARSQLVNSVLFNNGGANTFVLTNGASLSASYSVFEPGVTGYTDGGNNLTTTVSPFASTTSTQLAACSPAINTGSNQAYSGVSGPATDLAGNARQYNNGVIDRGAYEYQGNPTTLTVANPAVSTATAGQGFSQSFTASGGSGAYSFSVVSSNLPASLSVSGTGVLSGTPTVAGSYSVLVSAQDQNGCVGVASTAYNLTVNPAASLTPTITGFMASSQSVCAGSPITFTATIGNITNNYDWSLSNGGTPVVSPGPTTATAFSVVQTALGSGVQTFTLTVTSGGQVVTATTSLIVNSLPTASLINNGPLTCTQTSVTLTASGGASYSFTNSSGQLVPGSGNTRTVSSPGTYSVTVGDANGCVSTTSTTVGQNVIAASVSISPSSATLTNSTPLVSLTAVGSGTFLWSTGATTQVISVTTSGVYSVTLTNPTGCTATASVAVSGADLTVTLELPQANFAAPGSVGNFLVNVFEVGGLPTSSGNVTITITAPIGYTLSFASSLTSIQVSGGSIVPVDNSQWTITNSLSARQMTLTMNSGAFINGGGESSLGFSITRTSANSGSTASISVNVADDLTMTYDGNLANNVYARIITGL
ncbi:choice-of-anchor Q domain-containing protein [Spirosoma foliorum]|uniref:Uncharacterized protein n=1 Tax=Spirosoma foliorum TaxID=2710596 RepID=A0A7G5H3U1_9BACT|nr:choice-of-anchor Q domain-containing protein [Spirosoma foliorum]QMW05783.1 hypothetical protein H3H32_13255 [Spirosoma foliorum]